MKISILGVAQHFADKVHLVLDFAIGIRLPPPLSTIMAILTTLLVADI
jgi:hypothetical protein